MLSILWCQDELPDTGDDLIASCDDDTGYGWLAAYHIYTWSLLVSEGTQRIVA